MNNNLEVAFYHFTSAPLLKSVPSLLVKIYESKKKVLVLCKNEEELVEFDKYLWSFSTKVFIPHGTVADPHPEKQPVFLSTKIVNTNKPKVLLSFVDVDDEEMFKFKSVIFVFFGNEKDRGVLHMCHKYKDIRDKENIDAKFWMQDLSSGKWKLVK